MDGFYGWMRALVWYAIDFFYAYTLPIVCEVCP